MYIEISKKDKLKKENLCSNKLLENKSLKEKEEETDCYMERRIMLTIKNSSKEIINMTKYKEL